LGGVRGQRGGGEGRQRQARVACITFVPLPEKSRKHRNPGRHAICMGLSTLCCAVLRVPDPSCCSLAPPVVLLLLGCQRQVGWQ
jgi:hypothetical protein